MSWIGNKETMMRKCCLRPDESDIELENNLRAVTLVDPYFGSRWLL